ncbi:hypothetical protein [Rhizobium miluonense]|uniref:YcxB-like protein n=1 Tax=Rhizobium miluonense TaxID=411945 RepID=A0A1C3X8P4_9HYPH|nr:hypothetical protein [Rhizobium miluonense]SCB48617.1 hypothetical protein GA0061102_10677 [Rhizobium miluonense]
MTTGSEDDKSITLSFVRQPDEHVAIMRQAGRRFALRRPSNAQNATAWFVLSAIGVGAGLPVLFHLLRGYVFIPVFGLSSSIHEADMAIIWLVPTLIVYVLILVYSRWATRRRLATMQSRIRPDVTITVTANADGASWISTNTTIWLGWREIADISRRNGRIEFDLESFVTYIPASAFSNQGEQDAAFARILGFWRAAHPVQP